MLRLPLPDALRPFRRPRILVSYWYFKNRDMDEFVQKNFAVRPEIFADSGAFSAHSLGGSIDVHAYADWLHKWKHLLEVYANLDVKGDVDAGLRNQTLLEGKGLKPLPVWHSGEPWSVLEDMVDAYAYIALGGIAGGSMKNDSDTAIRMLLRCFRVAEGKAVYHGFGLTNWKMLSMLPWYSADSTSWITGVRYAGQKIFDFRKAKFHSIRFRDRKSGYRHRHLLHAYGIDWKYIDKPGRKQTHEMAALGAISYAVAERWLAVNHGEVPHPTQAKVGPRIYLSTASDQLFRGADDGMQRVARREDA